MRSLLLLLAAIVSQEGLCQMKLGEQAVFKECAKFASPTKCTNDKIQEDITAMFSPDIVFELKKSGKKYVTVSFVFITDADGWIVNSQTAVQCDVEAIRQLIIRYIEELPQFHPKNADQKERRSAHFYNIVFVANENGDKYYVAESAELRQKGIKSVYMPFDKAPIYPGCEEYGNDLEFECINTQISNFIAKRFVLPETKFSGQVRMLVTFNVQADGRLRIKKIEGGSETFRNEAIRVIRQLPKIEAAQMRGIPIEVPFTLPLTINIK